jgi:ferredoxin-NADP reductase
MRLNRTRLQHLKSGDPLLIGRKPTGTLIVDNLLPGRVLWLLSTGAGLAPFMSVIRGPAVYERYDRIVLCGSSAMLRDTRALLGARGFEERGANLSRDTTWSSAPSFHDRAGRFYSLSTPLH